MFRKRNRRRTRSGARNIVGEGSRRVLNGPRRFRYGIGLRARYNLRLAQFGILRVRSERRKTTGLDFLDVSGFYGADSPIRQKLVDHRFTEAVPAADALYGPAAKEVKLHNSLLHVARRPLEERPNLCGKSNQVPSDRRSQERVPQKFQPHTKITAPVNKEPSCWQKCFPSQTKGWSSRFFWASNLFCKTGGLPP